MFSTLITITLFVLLAIQGAFAGFAINTPPVTECTPTQISWAPSVAPYSLEIVSASDPCGNALQTITGLTTTVYHYTSDLKAGAEVLLYIADSAGNEAWSGNITVGSGSTSCTSSGLSSAVNTHTPQVPQASSTPTSSIFPSGLGGAINAGSSSSGVLTVHPASTPLVFTALAALLALTL